jgi:predicted dehydrogenase
VSRPSGSLRVGIVGYGEIARYHARHLSAAGAQLVGFVTSRTAPPGVARYASLTDMLPDVDAVTVAVPNHLHAALCLESVSRGIPVFVEKPLCITERELHALEAALPRATRPVHLGMRLRWNPALRALRARVRGARRVRCSYRLGIDRLAAGKPWTRREAESGGSFFTLGVHALDLARWITSAGARPIENLQAEASCRDAAADFPLTARMAGLLRDGAWIEASADLRGDAAFRLEVEVEADNGTFSDDSFVELRPEDTGAADAEFGGLMKHFVESATSGRPAADEIAEMLQCHRELLAARRRAILSPASGSNVTG